MQLREEQLKMMEDNEQTIQENYQLKIENEDLRDRMYLTTDDPNVRDQVLIEYQAYLPLLDFQNLLERCKEFDDVHLAKGIILTYIYSLRKENRNLQRRLNDRVGPTPEADENLQSDKDVYLEDPFKEFYAME